MNLVTYFILWKILKKYKYFILLFKNIKNKNEYKNEYKNIYKSICYFIYIKKK
jgi:hypothetical protein